MLVFRVLKDQVSAEAGQLLEIIADRPAIALAQLVRNGYQKISRLLRAADSVLRIALLGGLMFGLCLLRFRRQFK